ncbi:MAG TPA: thiamine pyrophosphate-dependent enzyme [Chloroflexota bacterium]|nr:thiamine pyrophosphate-dependent enzyme [Chloroflexota bacterium]
MAVKLDLKSYKSDVHNNWCPGCGDFGILSAIQMALLSLKIPPHRVALFSGIGCSGKTPHYVNVYGFHTLHGRVVPTATGAKIANQDLTVLAVGGDGDGYGIGSGYFVNAGRRNLDITYIVFNNNVYGLTKGQASPTMAKGLKTRHLPEATILEGLNPIALAVGAGYTFIARGYALDVRYLSNLLAQAISHKGSAFVDVLQTCPTYNDLYTKEWFDHSSEGGSRIYRLDDTGYDGVVHDPNDPQEMIEKKVQAVTRSYEWGEQIPVGVYYKVERPTYEEELGRRRPSLATKSLIDIDLNDRDVTPLCEALR